MELTVERYIYDDVSTIGKFSINGVFNCYTLEDKDRKLTADTPLADIEKIKVFGETAIPRGRYEVIISYSNHFGKDLPELLNVPGWAGVRIHPGNKAADTEGCLLLGTTESQDFIGHSVEAWSAFMEKLKAVIGKEKVFITIK